MPDAVPSHLRPGAVFDVPDELDEGTVCQEIFEYVGDGAIAAPRHPLSDPALAAITDDLVAGRKLAARIREGTRWFENQDRLAAVRRAIAIHFECRGTPGRPHANKPRAVGSIILGYYPPASRLTVLFARRGAEEVRSWTPVAGRTVVTFKFDCPRCRRHEVLNTDRALKMLLGVMEAGGDRQPVVRVDLIATRRR